MQKNLDFDLPEDISVIDVIYEILENNGLAENPEEWLEDRKNNKESRAMIIKDAALAIYQKIIPEDKLAELLARHLKTNKEVTLKVISDIKQRLVPYIKLINSEDKIKKSVPLAQNPPPVNQNNIPKIENTPAKHDQYREPTE